MAESQSEVMCTCPVCCDLFTEPVVLLCGHSFCKSCLKEWWRQSGQQACPVCKQLFPRAQPARNLALRDLSDTLRQERNQKQAAGSEEMCSLHDEKLKLFCHDDQLLICVICRDSQKHKNHNCAPVGEEAEENKKKLKVQLMHLKTKLASFKKEKLNCDKIAGHIKLQAQRTEKSIQEEFQKLYHFLREEEVARVDAVRKEAAQKSESINITLTNLNAEITSLEQKVQTIDRELKTKDLSFMQNFKSTLEQSQCNLAEPKTPSGALINLGEHLGNISFTVWEKMKQIIKYSPVTLDPNTSYGGHVFSENLTRLSPSKRFLQLPSNPERDGGGVLGCEGFISGKHSWDFEVADIWSAGVAAKTREKENIWGILVHHCNLPLLQCFPHKVIDSSILAESLKKIRVQLDYDNGILLFFDLDRKNLIHTIKHTFTCPVFPYFNYNAKILPAQLKVIKG